MVKTSEQRLTQWVNWFGLFDPPGIYTYDRLKAQLQGRSSGEKLAIRFILEVWANEDFGFKIRDALAVWGEKQVTAFKKIIDDIEEHGFP